MKLTNYLISEASTLSSVGVPLEIIKVIHTHLGVKHDMTYDKVTGKREATNELMNKKRLLVCHDRNGSTVVIAPPEMWDRKYYQIYELKAGSTKVESYTASTKKDVNRAIPSRGEFYVSASSGYSAGTGKSDSSYGKNRDAKEALAVKAKAQVKKSVNIVLNVKAKELYDKSMKGLHTAINAATSEEVGKILSNQYYWGKNDQPLYKALNGLQRAKEIMEAKNEEYGYTNVADELNDIIRKLYPQTEDVFRYGRSGGSQLEKFVSAVVSLSFDELPSYEGDDMINKAIDTPENIVRKVVAEWMRSF